MTSEFSKNKLVNNVNNVNPCNLLHCNQWKNRLEVIAWFKSSADEQHYKFIMFDIKGFY